MPQVCKHTTVAFEIREHVLLLKFCARKTLNLAPELTYCKTNHNIATTAKHPLSRGAGGSDAEVFFLANWQTCGELTLCSFHHRGSVSLSAGGVCEELFSSALIASLTHSSASFFFLSWMRLQGFSLSLFLFFFFCNCYSSFRKRPRGRCATVLTQQGSLTLCTECLKHYSNAGMTPTRSLCFVYLSFYSLSTVLFIHLSATISEQARAHYSHVHFTFQHIQTGNIRIEGEKSTSAVYPSQLQVTVGADMMWEKEVNTEKVKVNQK